LLVRRGSLILTAQSGAVRHRVLLGFPWRARVGLSDGGTRLGWLPAHGDPLWAWAPGMAAQSREIPGADARALGSPGKPGLAREARVRIAEPRGPRVRLAGPRDSRTALPRPLVRGARPSAVPVARSACRDGMGLSRSMVDRAEVRPHAAV